MQNDLNSPEKQNYSLSKRTLKAPPGEWLYLIVSPTRPGLVNSWVSNAEFCFCRNYRIELLFWLISPGYSTNLYIDTKQGVNGCKDASFWKKTALDKWCTGPLSMVLQCVLVSHGQIRTTEMDMRAAILAQKQVTLILWGAPVTNLFVKCHLNLHIDITLHYIILTLLVLLLFYLHFRCLM